MLSRFFAQICSSENQIIFRKTDVETGKQEVSTMLKRFQIMAGINEWLGRISWGKDTKSVMKIKACQYYKFNSLRLNSSQK